MREEWKYERLGDIATYINGFAFKPDDWGSEGLPIIRIQNLTDTQKEFNYCSRNDIPSKYYIENGDILISWSATLGVFEWSKGLALLNQHIFKVVFDKIKINKPYFKYVILASIEEMSRHTNGATMKHIRKGDFDNIKVPIPPLSEQERIVSLLDLEFAKIDAIKQNAEKQLQWAKDLFQSALKDLLTPKEGWEEKKLGNLCSLVRGPFGGSLKKDIFIDSGYAVYEQQHAIYKSIDIRYFIDENKYLSMKRFSVIPGDLIMSCSGTIGKVYVIPENAPAGIINQALLKMTPKKDVSVEYLAYLIESDYFKEIIFSYSDGAAIKNIAAVQILKELKICIPNFNEQLLIVQKLDILSEKVKELQSNYEQTVVLCNDLKQSLLKDIFG